MVTLKDAHWVWGIWEISLLTLQNINMKHQNRLPGEMKSPNPTVSG